MSYVGLAIKLYVKCELFILENNTILTINWIHLVHNRFCDKIGHILRHICKMSNSRLSRQYKVSCPHLIRQWESATTKVHASFWQLALMFLAIRSTSYQKCVVLNVVCLESSVSWSFSRTLRDTDGLCQITSLSGHLHFNRDNKDIITALYASDYFSLDCSEGIQDTDTDLLLPLNNLTHWN